LLSSIIIIVIIVIIIIFIISVIIVVVMTIIKITIIVMRDWRQVIVTVSMTHRRPHHVHAYGANKTPHYTTGDKNLDKLLTPTGFAGMLSTCCTLKATWRTCEAPSFG